MQHYHYSKNWRALLLALPLLMGSLTGQASEYTIGFGAPSQDSNTLKNEDGKTVWTYSTTGTVGNFSYTDDEPQGLYFYLNPSSAALNSLTLTSVQTFSGPIKSIRVACADAYGMEIKAYAGQTELGELVYNQKTMDYGLTQLSYGMLSEPLSLKFTASPQAENGGSVSGLSSVKVYIDDTVLPLPDGRAVTFDPSELSTAVLSNYSYMGILFTLNESNNDGFAYEDGEGIIYLESVLTDAAVDGLNNAVRNHSYSPGDPGYAIDFAGGITMMVSKGKGFIKIEAENEPAFAYHIKVGDNAPVQLSSTNRKWLAVPYDVNQDTYVYIYMVQKASGSRAGTRIGRRGTAHGKIYSAKSVSTGGSFVLGDADGSGKVDLKDVKAIANDIMGTPPAGFNKVQADVNGDEIIDVADLVEVVQIVKNNP
jgi:hypothetical protein